MKKLYLILFFIAVSTSTISAQSNATKSADKHYDRLEYTDAIDSYLRLVENGKADSYVYERLANSYYYINDTKNAATYYKRVVDNGNAENVYNYAQCLKATGKFEESNTWMQKFAEINPSDSRAVEFMSEPNYIPKILGEVQKFTVTNAGDINSEYSEYGGLLVGNQFYFSTARNEKRRNYGWNEQPYLDIYSATKTGDVIGSSEMISGDVNSKYHEGTVAITADGKRMIFDRNDFFKGKYKKDEEGVNQLNLYTAEWVNNKWTDIKPVPFNSENYSTAHPSLSPDGNTLYFASDMPGGKGMSDIYKVSIDSNGNFGTPENVSSINTEGMDSFPFIGDSGTIYFSSNGHMGIGGLDVFYAEANENGFGETRNLGLPVNSGSDDFAFTINEASQEGFVSSDREGGKGSDDIYLVKQIEPLCDVTIVATVYDSKTRKPLRNAMVDIFDNKKNKISTKMTDRSGNVTYIVECDEMYVLQASLIDYESNSTNISPTRESDVTASIGLNPIEEIIKEDMIVLNPILFDLDKHNIKAQAAFELDKLVQVMKKYPTMIIRVESHTDNRATNEYNMTLSNNRAQSTVQYVISKGIDASRISGVGMGEENLKVDCGDSCTEDEHQQNRRSEFIIVKR